MRSVPSVTIENRTKHEGILWPGSESMSGLVEEFREFFFEAVYKLRPLDGGWRDG
jgi:hypothetical protein